MAEAIPKPSSQQKSFSEEIAIFLKWCRENPVTALWMAAILGVLVYFFGVLHPFTNGSESTALWGWRAWSPEGDQEHGKLAFPIAVFLAWYHRDKIRAALKKGSGKGLFWVFLGIVLFVLSFRCLQPRMALASLPVLIYGITCYLWGGRVARIILFPCAFLVFMIPFAAVEQATFRLQFIVTGIVGFLSNIIGIQIQAVGTTLTAADGSFDFEIAEGCSGIRSITAMAMLTAVFVHLTQNRLWKKIVIFAASVVFAVVGNVGRIFTVILVAKFLDPKIAGGIYHDYSGFVFFPFALLAMLGFSKLLNIDYRQAISTDPSPGGRPGGNKINYDY
jgi:exosortase